MPEWIPTTLVAAKSKHAKTQPIQYITNQVCVLCHQFVGLVPKPGNEAKYCGTYCRRTMHVQFNTSPGRE